MIPVDMAFEDLTAARVMNVRTAGVGNIRGFINNGRVTGTFQAPGRIVGWSHFGYDSILPAGFFKGYIPVINTLDQVWNPFLRRSRIDIINDLFLGFNQLATKI